MMDRDSIAHGSYHVVIVGGGISGLATAYSVMKESRKTGIEVRCTVLERDPRWGGKVLTHTVEHYLIEGGPDSFLTSKPSALELCRELGLQDELISTNPLNNRTFAFCRGALRELPQGLLAFRPQRVDTLVSSGLLSWKGMVRMAAERYWPKTTGDEKDESLGEFFRRRFGTEAFDHLIEPLVAGIYAGDANELSLRATFPRFRDLERVHGSVIKGMRLAQATTTAPLGSPKESSLFMSLRGGLSDLIQALMQKLTEQGVSLISETGCRELRLPTRESPGFQVIPENGPGLSADAVVLATPTFQSASLLRSIQPNIAGLLDDIPYASTATISLAYPVESVGSKISGFGFIVPRKEKRPLLAATWTSLKWPGRCREDQVLVRGYIGGQGRETILEQEDRSLVDCVRRELENIVGMTAAPTYTEVHRWHQGMPQYVIGHLDRLAKINGWLTQCPGLYLTGAGYYGIGIPDCIREGTKIGQQLVQDLPQNRAHETSPKNLSGSR